MGQSGTLSLIGGRIEDFTKLLGSNLISKESF